MRRAERALEEKDKEIQGLIRELVGKDAETSDAAQFLDRELMAMMSSRGDWALKDVGPLAMLYMGLRLLIPYLQELQQLAPSQDPKQPRFRGYKGSEVWDLMVRQLLKWAEGSDYSIATSKHAERPPSPFTKFIYALQMQFPKQYQRHISNAEDEATVYSSLACELYRVRRIWASTTSLWGKRRPKFLEVPPTIRRLFSSI